jgi:hypothetical protein
MTISLTIDNCAWDFFFRNKYDLCLQLPADKFLLFITREVELELLQIPDYSPKDGSDKRALKEYIQKSRERRQVVTACVFGFDCGESPDDPARFGGFGQGTFESDIERDWRQREDIQSHVIGASKRKTTVLRQNEADVAQSVASLSSVLITNESNKKKGPILIAAANGGRVLYLSDFESSGLTLADYIEKHFAEPTGTS